MPPVSLSTSFAVTLPFFAAMQVQVVAVLSLRLFCKRRGGLQRLKVIPDGGKLLLRIAIQQSFH